MSKVEKTEALSILQRNVTSYDTQHGFLLLLHTSYILDMKKRKTTEAFKITKLLAPLHKAETIDVSSVTSIPLWI